LSLYLKSRKLIQARKGHRRVSSSKNSEANTQAYGNILNEPKTIEDD